MHGLSIDIRLQHYRRGLKAKLKKVLKCPLHGNIINSSTAIAYFKMKIEKEGVTESDKELECIICRNFKWRDTDKE